jgi:hypothetical protein
LNINDVEEKKKSKKAKDRIMKVLEPYDVKDKKAVLKELIDKWS